MEWRRCEPGGASDPPPAARIGHIAVAVDARAIWGTELLVVHGGIGEDKHALRFANAWPTKRAHWTCFGQQSPAVWCCLGLLACQCLCNCCTMPSMH